jgi:nucleoside phosphorylase
MLHRPVSPHGNSPQQQPSYDANVTSAQLSILLLAPTRDEARAIARALKLTPTQKAQWQGRYQSQTLLLLQTGMGANCLDALNTLDTATTEQFRHVVLAGYAAGIAPGMNVGDVLLASAIHTDTDVIPLPTIAKGDETDWKHQPLAFSQSLLADRHDKQQCHVTTKAAAADMESAHVARWAKQYDLSLAILRVVSDAHDDAMPTWLGECVDQQGNVLPGAAFTRLALRPDRWLALRRVIKKVAVARQAFARVMPKLIDRLNTR